MEEKYTMEKKKMERLIIYSIYLISVIVIFGSIFFPAYTIYLFLIGLITISTNALSQLILGVSEFKEKDFVYTSTGTKNWKEAIDMVKSLKEGHRAFDISSFENIPEFDKYFIKKTEASLDAQEGEHIHLRRILVCDPEKDKKTANWLTRMLDPMKDKKEIKGKHYDCFREAIGKDILHILHFPHPIFADFFITENPEDEKAEVIFGFPKSKMDKKYTSGMRIKDRKLSKDFIDYFEDYVWAMAKDHLRNVKSNKVKCSLCERFKASDDYSTLLPKSG